MPTQMLRCHTRLPVSISCWVGGCQVARQQNRCVQGLATSLSHICVYLLWPGSPTAACLIAGPAQSVQAESLSQVHRPSYLRISSLHNMLQAYTFMWSYSGTLLPGQDSCETLTQDPLETLPRHCCSAAGVPYPQHRSCGSKGQEGRG